MHLILFLSWRHVCADPEIFIREGPGKVLRFFFSHQHIFYRVGLPGVHTSVPMEINSICDFPRAGVQSFGVLLLVEVGEGSIPVFPITCLIKTDDNCCEWQEKS